MDQVRNKAATPVDDDWFSKQLTEKTEQLGIILDLNKVLSFKSRRVKHIRLVMQSESGSLSVVDIKPNTLTERYLDTNHEVVEALVKFTPL